MVYKITEVLGDYEAQYGKRRVDFKVEGNPNKVSGFMLHAPNVGDSLEGEIVQNGQWYNFKFPMKQNPSTPTTNDAQYLTLLREIQAVNTNVLRVVALLEEKNTDSPF